jgi:hypothetical protein
MKTIKISNTEVIVEMSIGWKYYGQYSISAMCCFLQEKKNISFHSTDSELYDKRRDDNISYEEYQDMLFNRVESDLESILTEEIYNLNN